MRMNNDLLAGSPAPSFDDPLGMLRACHRRIEKHLATLQRLQRHVPEHGCDDEARSAARAILRYFDNAGANHDADEERSLLPRLIASGSTEARAIEVRVHSDHRELAARWMGLRALLAGIAAGQRANLAPRDVGRLCAIYEGHIAYEESTLLPFAEATLDAESRRAIGKEMAARRDVDIDAVSGGR